MTTKQVDGTVTLSLPPHWHEWLRQLYPELQPHCGLSGGEAKRCENRPTEWREEGSELWVTSYGDDFFHRLQDEYSQTERLLLPCVDDYTGVAAELVEVLGWAFWELKFPSEATRKPVLEMRRLLSAPAAASPETELDRRRSLERGRVDELQQQFEERLKHVALGQFSPGGAGPQTLSEVKQAWRAQLEERRLKHREIFVTSERYWRWHMLGSLEPVFMSEEHLQQWREATERVGESVQRAVERVAADDALRLHLLGSTEPISVDRPSLCRWDGAQTNLGIQFFELNVGVVGLSDVDMAAAIYADLGLGRGLGTRLCPVFSNLSNFLKRVFRERFPGRETPSLCVPYAEGMPTVFATALLTLTAAFRAAGWDARFALLSSLSFDGELLRYADGTPVSLIARGFFPGAPGSEVVREAEEAGAVYLVNRPAPHGSKSLFELLDDPAIPWTRIVNDRGTSSPDGEEVELISYALAQQQRLVLKPSDGYGGRSVLLGWTTPAAEWRQAVEQAAADYADGRRSILQLGSQMPQAEFVDRQIQVRSMYWDINAYLFDGEFGGLMSRLSGGALTNVSLGGGAAPVYVV